MTRTTPPRPVDIAAAFPQLAPLARTTTRLHPRPGPTTASDSSIGGPLLWPAEEPWPHCDGPHEGAWGGMEPTMLLADVRLARRITAASSSREPALQGTGDVPEGPIAMLPIAQLYARDVPCLRPPADTDMLQVLWCPFSHGDELVLRTQLFWRTSGEITDVLEQAPEPAAVQLADFVPDACQVHPENVTEYPRPEYTHNPVEGIDSDLSKALEDWGSVLQYEDLDESFYRSQLSVAPGCKVGGWAGWSRTDAIALNCTVCDAPMDPLLTIASREWGGDGYTWIPHEDQGLEEHEPRLNNPTGLQLGDADDLQLFACSADPAHPHTSRVT